MAELERLEFEKVRMRGQTARRTVRHFGVDYDYQGGTVSPGKPLPASFEWLRERSAALAGLDADDLAQTLVSRYPPRAGIGWHRDAPMFGSKIVGVSLLSESRLRLRPRKEWRADPDGPRAEREGLERRRPRAGRRRRRGR